MHYSHTFAGLLLHTLTTIRYTGDSTCKTLDQLSWPNGGKKNRVYRFSMGWYISTWFIM